MPSSKKFLTTPLELIALNWYFSGPTENYWNETITCQYYKYILERVWSELVEYSPDKFIGSVVWQIVWWEWYWIKISMLLLLYLSSCKPHCKNLLLFYCDAIYETTIIWGKIVPYKIIHIKLFRFYFYFVIIFVAFCPI